MTMIPEVHTALRGAVQAGAVRRRRPRPRHGLTLALAAGLAISGTAIAATGVWRPVLGNERSGHPKPAGHPLPMQLAQAVRALDRPQSDADRALPVQEILKNGLYHATSRPFIADIRLLAKHPGGVAVLIPLDRLDYQRPNGARHDELCVFYSFGATADHPGGGTNSCGDLRHFRAGTISGAVAADRTLPNGARFITGSPVVRYWGLVPNDVARVKIALYGAIHLDAAVRDNFYDVQAPEFRAIKTLQWFAADGTELRIPPSPGEISRSLRRQRAAKP